jgi:hypothetical protein
MSARGIADSPVGFPGSEWAIPASRRPAGVREHQFGCANGLGSCDLPGPVSAEPALRVAPPEKYQYECQAAN